jgi:hypothetical protein
MEHQDLRVGHIDQQFLKLDAGVPAVKGQFVVLAWLRVRLGSYNSSSAISFGQLITPARSACC